MKNKKKPAEIVAKILQILQFIACIFLIYTIFLIDGVENELRYIGMIAILLINIISILILGMLAKTKKKTKYIIFVVITLLLSIIQVVVGYYVFSTYSSISNMNKDKVTYESALVVKNDSPIANVSDLNDKKIGIVVDETSIDGYILAQEIINDNNLNSKNTVIDYDSYSSLVADLYSGDIDAMLISKNYPTMFTSIEAYANIATDTKIVTTKSKEYKKDEIEKITGETNASLNSSGTLTEPFTILVMGVDSEVDGLDKNATGNGDALMLVTFNPKTLNATILSIPRDTYVPIMCFANQKENKITHAAWNGSSCMISTIENFTGINIDYYVKINFKGVVQVVDALGGIEVDVPEILDGVCESDSDRSILEENLKCFTKGPSTLDGEHALAMARHRKTLPLGDIQRGLNQQLVIEAIINKASTISSANQALDLLNAVSRNIDTNFSTKQILSFYDIAKTIYTTSKTKTPFNIQQLYLSGASQMIYDEGIGLVLYNYIYNQTSLDQDVSAMKKNLGLESVDNEEKAMDFDIEDEYASEVIGKSNLAATKTYNLLSDYTGSSISYARSQLSGIPIHVIEKEVSAGSGYSDGEIISQDMPESKRIDLIGSNGITFTVASVTSSSSSTSSSTDDGSSSGSSSSSSTDDGSSSGSSSSSSSSSGDSSGSSSSSSSSSGGEG